MTKFSYDEWIKEQADHLRSSINRLAMSGIFNGAIYVIPSNGATPGSLVLSTTPIEGAVDIVRFPKVGDRVSAVPSSHLTQHLWNACRRLPICPVQ